MSEIEYTPGDEPSTQDNGPQSPGTMLRRARERAHLSREELATLTRLAKGIIEALENDDFPALREPVYAKGYYRKCARALSLDEDVLIAGYVRMGGRAAIAIKPSALKLAPSEELGKRRESGAPLGFIFVVLVIIVALAWWLLYAQPRQVTMSMMSSPDQPQGSGGLIQPPPQSESAPAGGDATPAAGDTAATAPSGGAMPLPPPQQGGDTAPAGSGAADASSAAAADTPTAAAADAAPASSNGLQLVFSATSWVRVEDSQGKVVLDGLVSAGETRQVGGTPPYNVFLGNAPGVSVSFNGEKVDTAPYVKANSTARFKIPVNPG